MKPRPSSDAAHPRRSHTPLLLGRVMIAKQRAAAARRPRRQPKGFIDYTLRVKVNNPTQPVAVALIEAKGREVTEALATLRRPS